MVIYCCLRLSCCFIFVEVSAFNPIPGIAIIEQNAVFKKIVKVGSSNILTHVFKIQKTPT